MVDRAGLVKMVQSLRGVRTVTDHLTPAALEPARFRLELSDGQAVLTGLLPDRQAVEKLETAAAALVDRGKPTSRVDAQLGVATPAWLAALTTLIPELKGALTAGVEAGPAGLIITGTVPSEAERERIGTRAAALFAGVLSVENRIRVLPPKRPAGLTLSLEAGTLALGGELPGQAEIDRVHRRGPLRFSRRENHRRAHRRRRGGAARLARARARTDAGACPRRTGWPQSRFRRYHPERHSFLR